MTARPSGAFCSPPSPMACVVRRVHQQDAVRGGNAHRHDRTHERLDVQRGPRRRQHPEDADERARHRHEDDEGIEERLEEHHQQQVHQCNRQDEADAHPPEGLEHALALAAHVDASRLRQRRQRLDRLLDRGRDASQVAPAHVRVDVDDALH